MEKLAILGGTPTRTAPWPKWPVYDESDEQRLLDVFRSGNWWRHSYGQGVELIEDEKHPRSTVAQFQHQFALAHECKYGICAANGTVTMEIALRAAGIKPGDEVIIPPYTYVATATAPLMVGAIPIFVDIDPDTYNLDVKRLEEAITERTRAIIPVHFGGQPCEMDEINQIARKYDLIVLEDAAHAHGSMYRGHKCGSLSQIGSFSFQLSKNMTAGEGGIITTNNEQYAETCEMLVWAGRKVGHPWYQHFVLASNARMTEFQGAILQGQLSRLEGQNDKRTANALVLDRELKQIEGIDPLVRLASTTRSSNHIYMFRYHAEAFGGVDKAHFTAALQAEG
ncbi:MAG: DegT/DnrJ/EryC1/StrS family aminotransferase, partial [Chloroflexota bacterium]